jgi:hypothetical protein
MATGNADAPRVRSSQTGKPWIWSIGIYGGKSPLHLAPANNGNPVLSAGDVTDVPARFVADPFMQKVDGLWHMFFEVLNNQNDRGEIGLATSRDGLRWQYQEIVLREPFHLSYPYVFRWQDDFYMIPEGLGAEAVRLYRATAFPRGWTLVKNLFSGTHADPSIFRCNERWWLYTCPLPYQHDTLALYSAADLTSTWVEHPMSPLIRGNRSIARPAGRVIFHDGKPLRFAQDCVPIYGKQVRAFEVTELTTTTYKDSELPESPVITPTGSGWNASGMHHVDAHQLDAGRFLACVDGLKNF